MTLFIGDFFKVLLNPDVDYLRFALIAAILVGLLAPLIGIVVVIRRLSFIANTLSHFSLAGATLGVFLSKLLRDTPLVNYISTLWLGILFSIIGTLMIEKLRSFYKNYKELSMPIVLSLGVALSGVFIALSEGGAQNLTNSLLFGSIYTVSKSDLILIIAITLIISVFIVLYYKQIITLCFDEIFARVSGVNVKALQVGITVVLALFISIFMEIIGVLLISALMIIPVSSSILIGKSFKNSCLYAILFSEISVLLGFIISYVLGLPTGAMIVLFNIFILIIIMTIQKIFLRKQKKSLKT
ncbi:MAG TPA: metal ABC transporter permease [Acholeplasmataceae bacterium]|nr:metal ABC transporter permease [Acholeplasmataceae bacterium]